MIGKTLAHYKITGLLGKGGMGEVYRALDTRLKREVALKVLPLEMAQNSERLERFRREARTLASVDHPNIVAIYSVEEADGVHFVTMGLVEGKTLGDLVPRSGLDLESFFELALPLAGAVAAAHAKGITHRDLKPANIMVADEDRRLKVLDFGLARHQPGVAEMEATQLETMTMTQEGVVLGTVPYMSPEQASGKQLDHRTDIFSLGIILYELATGERPFQGANAIELMSAMLKDTPPVADEIKPELPRHLGRIVGRCLEKDPADRYQTARDVYNELRTLRKELGAKVESDTDAARSSRPVIAVLPFRSLSEDTEIEDFTASLGDDVVDGVTSTSQAVVLPASATQRFSDQSADAREVGEELGAGYVVQGAVRRSGNRLRVSAQLVSVKTGTQIWSRRYDRDLSKLDLMDAGDEIGARIVSAISDVHGVIFEVERQRLEGRAVAELDPWECIFVTLSYDKFLDAEHHQLAREALERALELDPGFSLAWGYYSWVATDEELHGFNPRPRSMQRAMSAARRAVELDPSSHMLRWLLARVLFFEGDVEGFLSEGNKALELNSNDATVIGLVGLYTSLSGHWRRGEELMRRAMALNPSYPSYYHWALALDQLRQGHYEEALTEYRRLSFTGNPFFQRALAAILGHLGRTDEASAVLREASSLGPDSTPGAIRAMYERWNLGGELLEALTKGLTKAGLEEDA